MNRLFAAVLVGLGLTAMVGCTEDDVLYCDLLTPCSSGLVCDYGKRECVVKKVDRGAPDAPGGSQIDGPVVEAGSSDAGGD